MKNRFSLFALVFIALVYVGIRFSDPPKNIISYDVFGLYLYLPAIFIHGDVSLQDISFIEDAVEKYNSTPMLYQLTRLEEGNWLIRFFIGISILYLPFFMGGHLYALATHYPADGFSEPYQWALIISGIFYTLLGIFMLRKVLLKFFSDGITAITMLLLFIGSNIIFFGAIGSDSPHVYVFTLYTFILWFTIKWHESPRFIYAIFLGLLLGLTVIARPSEIIAAFIPLFWGVKNREDLRNKWKLVLDNRNQVIAFVIAGIAGIMPQFIYWYTASGNLIVNTYDDPASGLNLLGPRFGWALFSFRKGLYIWAPLMVFATVGFIPLFRNNKKIFLSLFLFFIFNVYLISGYSSLISYGWRAFIQSYAVMAIPLGYFVLWLSGRKNLVRIAFSAIFTFIIVLNVFQLYQWKKGVLDGSRMTGEYYFATFFKTSATEEDRKLLLIERPSTDIESLPENAEFAREVLYFNDFEKKEDAPAERYDTSFTYSGSYSVKMDSTYQFSPGFFIRFRDLTDNYYAWISSSVKIKADEDINPDDVLLISTFDYKGKYYKYRSGKLSTGKATDLGGGWKELRLDYLTPEPRSKRDELSVYVWYRGKKPIFIDDLKVELFNPID